MRPFLFLFAFAVTTCTLLQAQTEPVAQSTRDRINYSNVMVPNTGAMYSIKGEAGKTIGDPYFDTTWQAGNVKFYNRLGTSLTTDSLAGVPVRLDLSANEVEVRASAKDIRVAKGTAVRYIDMNTQLGSVSRFMNVREYRGDSENLTGFFEQIVTGKIDLLQFPSIYVKRANFNVAMNTGTKDDELIKRFDWYVVKDKMTAKFSPGKKALLELMADKKDQVETFLKNEKPDLKSRSGLTATVRFYNSL